jgi:hypothetical protein
LPEGRKRDAILLDETKVKRNGKMAYVSVCLSTSNAERGPFIQLHEVGIVSIHDLLG